MSKYIRKILWSLYTLAQIFLINKNASGESLNKGPQNNIVNLTYVHCSMLAKYMQVHWMSKYFCRMLVVSAFDQFK